ncbi:MAG TPA: hypothetical protein VLW84_02575 [Terriglobales bacterium]|nr:hypothetical protein [Terriglobales bacterium]
MQTVRVLVANRPRLMRDLVLATIADEPDIDVVGVVEDEAGIFIAVEKSRPDFLIIGLDAAEQRPKICDLLLDCFPHMRILAVQAEHNSAMFYWACLEIRSNQVESSEAGILSTLRGGKLFRSTSPATRSKSRAN